MLSLTDLGQLVDRLKGIQQGGSLGHSHGLYLAFKEGRERHPFFDLLRHSDMRVTEIVVNLARQLQHLDFLTLFVIIRDVAFEGAGSGPSRNLSFEIDAHLRLEFPEFPLASDTVLVFDNIVWLAVSILGFPQFEFAP